MELFLRRFIHKQESTIGYILMDGVFSVFTLEDQRQTKKVRGETRIPSGRYEVNFKTEPTPLTAKYRAKYDFFTWHLEVKNVVGFKSIYIHTGNYDEHTDGCILVGLTADTIYGGATEDMIGHSRKAFKQLYIKVKSALERDERVSIIIVNN